MPNHKNKRHFKIIGKIETYYEDFEFIDSGNYGEVYKAVRKLDPFKIEFAIKKIEKQSLLPNQNGLDKHSLDRASLLQEMEILQRTSHKNLMQMHEILESPTHFNIVLEYMNGGTLNSYLTD